MGYLATLFSKTNRVFENARLTSLVRHEIEFPLIARFNQISSNLFQMLDRSDSIQADISRRLWVLRSTFLFTILPFHDSALRLELQMKELRFAAESTPETNALIESLGRCISEIVTDTANPKREWLIRFVTGSAENDLEHTGILTALSAGVAPGWPVEKSLELKELIGLMMPIESRKTLKSNVFQRVILPCACSNVSPYLISDLLFSGVARKFDVLLYPGEKFQIPKRLCLPSDDLFSSRLQKTQIEREVLVVNGNESVNDDSWINEAFWQGLHGAARDSSYGCSSARYILFSDGAGAFFPADGRVITLPADGNVTSESDLCLLPVENISEGDIVVVRSGDSGFLLDTASNRIMGRSENDTLFHTATTWKEPLDALLVTHTCEEVAIALSERGVSTRAASIKQWVGPEVLGPKDEHVFRALLNLLAEKNKIQKSEADLTNYVDQCWYALQSLRGLHQKAGNLIRQDLFKALFKRFRDRNTLAVFSARETIYLEGDTGAALLIMRVHSVDNSIAYISPSRLGKIDDLKGNKWLG